MDSGRLLTPVAWLLVIVAAAIVALTSASTDPRAAYCDHGCKAFTDVSNQCSLLRKCSKYPDHYDRCVKPCQDLSKGCLNLCWNTYTYTMTQCSHQCDGSSQYDCAWNCFQNKFAAMRDEELTLPSPDIGPFQP